MVKSRFTVAQLGQFMDGMLALVVDDSKSARFAMRRFLESSGQEVDTADSGLDALERMRLRLPDIVFLDHIMPVLDGFAVLEMLKRDAALASVPVVLCTSNDSVDFAKMARSRGVREVLVKPPSAERLAALLDNIANAPAEPPAAFEAAEPVAETPPPAFAPAPPPMVAEASSEAPFTPPLLSRVQPIRDPEDAIERAVMKTLREALPAGAFFNGAETAAAPKPAPVSLASTLAQPAVATDNNLAPRIEALRDQFQNRMQQVTRELVSQIGNLRTQLAQLEAAESVARSGDDERLNLVQQSQFVLESRIDRMASHFDGVLDALRSDMEAQYQSQAQRIERVARETRAAAVDEAHAVSERVVMNAAKRISDQVAESVLSVLKPVPTQHFR